MMQKKGNVSALIGFILFKNKLFCHLVVAFIGTFLAS